MSSTSRNRCIRASQVQRDLFLLGHELVVAPATCRIACVVGVEGCSGPQGTLPSLGGLVALVVHGLEPLGSLCLILTVFWAQC